MNRDGTSAALVHSSKYMCSTFTSYLGSERTSHARGVGLIVALHVEPPTQHTNRAGSCWAQTFLPELHSIHDAPATDEARMMPTGFKQGVL